ncbi:hypothetical protein OG607_02585 [Streptomyces sp. NBC_01537]
MKIVQVETIPFAIPYAKPLKLASGEVRTADHVLVRLHTDEGLTGTAEAPPRPYTYGETQESIIAMIDKIPTPQLLGLSVLEREAVHARLDRTVGNPTAKAAIDMALWDIVGQVAGMSVSGLLGGYTDRMRVCHMAGFAQATEMVAEAQRIRDTYGVTTFKVKVGRQPYTEDVAACRALREALGTDVELYTDSNRGWTASDSARPARDGRPRADLRRGTLPRRRCARAPLAGRAEPGAVHRRRERHPPR